MWLSAEAECLPKVRWYTAENETESGSYPESNQFIAEKKLIITHAQFRGSPGAKQQQQLNADTTAAVHSRGYGHLVLVCVTMSRCVWPRRLRDSLTYFRRSVTESTCSSHPAENESVPNVERLSLLLAETECLPKVLSICLPKPKPKFDRPLLHLPPYSTRFH